MSRPRYISVTFTWRGTPKIQELEPLFGTALDWLRYSNNCWILWTVEDPFVWFNYIKPHLGVNDSVLIAEISLANLSYTGWQPRWIIDWFEKKRP